MAQLWVVRPKWPVVANAYADNKNQNQPAVMLEPILIPLLTGLIGILIGNRIRLGGDAHAKRIHFRAYVTLWRKTVDGTDGRALAFAYGVKDTPKFEAEVLEVYPHIRRCRRARLDAACAAFKKIHFIDAHRSEQENDKSKDDLLAVLRELYDCAK